MQNPCRYQDRGQGSAREQAAVRASLLPSAGDRFTGRRKEGADAIGRDHSGSRSAGGFGGITADGWAELAGICRDTWLLMMKAAPMMAIAPPTPTPVAGEPPAMLMIVIRLKPSATTTIPSDSEREAGAEPPRRQVGASLDA